MAPRDLVDNPQLFCHLVGVSVLLPRREQSLHIEFLRRFTFFSHWIFESDVVPLMVSNRLLSSESILTFSQKTGRANDWSLLLVLAERVVDTAEFFKIPA